jgi:hypothetical protein
VEVGQAGDTMAVPVVDPFGVPHEVDGFACLVDTHPQRERERVRVNFRAPGVAVAAANSYNYCRRCKTSSCERVEVVKSRPSEGHAELPIDVFRSNKKNKRKFTSFSHLPTVLQGTITAPASPLSLVYYS